MKKLVALLFVGGALAFAACSEGTSTSGDADTATVQEPMMNAPAEGQSMEEMPMDTMTTDTTM
ncbi:hypothetical protein SAMN05421823_103354 [Catalinimonas alkaloidigena]|uniref:Uncharacterized protein n=1 Tax=Catalinimonas alkaloidigena TaxID=1075417 RepID=A0A1G9E5B8_9BACT|nr:hypothetical protein [Catalinimonas alkaloidigena]SDK71304.1 hypothetical protein SAMN05421823_103354 [Catalinimonas alkaloidigena]